MTANCGDFTGMDDVITLQPDGTGKDGLSMTIAYRAEFIQPDEDNWKSPGPTDNQYLSEP
jgi:hypothetical protein